MFHFLSINSLPSNMGDMSILFHKVSHYVTLNYTTIFFHTLEPCMLKLIVSFSICTIPIQLGSHAFQG